MNVLAIGAHPDDIEFGCGAVLVQEARKGNRIHLLVLSRGEAGSHGTPEGRESESRAAGAMMGAKVTFLDLGGDCHIEYRPENTIGIAREIRVARPDVILAPYPAENQHPDHVAAGRMARDACRLARYAGLVELIDLPPHRVGSLLFYNITSHIGHLPGVVVDISGVMGEWEALMRCHASQVGSKGYIELQKTSARLLGLAAGTEYAAGLFTNDPLRVSGLAEVSASVRAW